MHLVYDGLPTSRNIEAIEKVQRHTTKQLPGMQDISYQETRNLETAYTVELEGIFKILHDQYYCEVANIAHKLCI